MAQTRRTRQKFFVEVIKPSHYDDDGYVIQWFRALMPANSLACVYSLVQDVENRRALGDEIEIVATPYDEAHTVIPVRRIIRRIRANGGRGVVFLVGVQTNQMPRATDLARRFREAGVQVAIGGFHVSGCLAMIPELPDDLKALQTMGVTIFAGEAEGRMEGLLRDALRGALQPVYNYLSDLPDLRGQPAPQLPRSLAQRYMLWAPFDCGRGCPFQCSFCTIINVQGRKSRFRDPDDVEQLVRANVAQGIRHYFITDDNFARNKNWEAILDRLIAMREKEGIRFKFMIQVDTMSHRIPGFVEKSVRAGCSRIFIGLENINPANLTAANKPQNHVREYRAMLQAWRTHGVLTYAGYILGFPHDTPESIERDIKIIQQQLPIDILEFMILTPLPGSADHKALYERGTWMDPDLNKYDVEHVTTRHPRMTAEEWQSIYHRAWHLYYTPEHVETLLRRAKRDGVGARHMTSAVMAYYASYRFEKLHPLQSGAFRRKHRTERRSGLPRENPFWFHLRRVWEIASTYVGLGLYWLQIERIRRRVEREPAITDDSQLGTFLAEPFAQQAKPAAEQRAGAANQQQRRVA